MSKIFNLEFSFLNQRHSALISVNSNQLEPYVHVQLINSIFKQIIPTGHIRYRGYEGYKKLDIYHDPFIRKIVDVIANEINSKLNYQYSNVKNLFSYMWP